VQESTRLTSVRGMAVVCECGQCNSRVDTLSSPWGEQQLEHQPNATSCQASVELDQPASLAHASVAVGAP
jgi:hypothetical protein